MFFNILILNDGNYKYAVYNYTRPFLYFNDISNVLKEKYIEKYSSAECYEIDYKQIISLKVGLYFDMKKEFEEKTLLKEII